MFRKCNTGTSQWYNLSGPGYAWMICRGAPACSSLASGSVAASPAEMEKLLFVHRAVLSSFVVISKTVGSLVIIARINPFIQTGSNAKITPFIVVG